MGLKDYVYLTMIILVTKVIGNLVTGCDPKDLRALQGFMAVLQNPPENWEANSSSVYCCDWEGVTCDSFGIGPKEGRRVLELELPRRRLVGKLSDSLGSLDQLRNLNLSNNFLRGSIPVSVFNLTNLRLLDLSFNSFTGPAPDFSGLSSIQHLDLSRNLLNGSLPERLCSGGGDSSDLKVVELAGNLFSGEVPSGFGDCSSLERLGLGTNDLAGVSEGLFKLRKLSVLSLADNKLSGELSIGISGLANLVLLDISSNEFSGPIPDAFHKLRKLKSFVAHSNRFSGRIPTSLSSSPTLSRLNLRNNSLAGTIKLNCSAMVELTSLDLASNLFSGSVPGDLPTCHHLNLVSLSRNNLTGNIPKSFENFQSLSYLSLSNVTNTNLSSALKVLHRCENLTTLVLSMNFYEDELPADPDLRFPRLKTLVIANCRLTGSVPRWLSMSSSLKLLDLSFNRLAGMIPGWLGDLEFLFYLDLSNNSFTGEIPKSFTRLPSLVNGDIPIEEGFPDFQLSWKRNARARSLQYNQLWSLPPTLDLSFNHLSGPIWPEFGNLRRLHVLYLRFNNLLGPIPNTLSGMLSLESLDLSHNNLSGTIPLTLAGLNFLSWFNVEFNGLHGPIPTSGQFLTFPSSSFRGNDLCGVQTEKPCGPSVSDSRESTALEEPRTSLGGFVEAIGVGVGVGTTFGLVLGVVLFQILSRKHGMFQIHRSDTKPTRLYFTL